MRDAHAVPHPACMCAGGLLRVWHQCCQRVSDKTVLGLQEDSLNDFCVACCCSSIALVTQHDALLNARAAAPMAQAGSQVQMLQQQPQ